MSVTADLSNVSRTTMEPIVRAYDAQIDSVNTKERTLVARINTSALDRYNTVIDPKGARLDNYRRNPVVLWEHGKDPRRFTDPIGRNLWVRSSGGEAPLDLLAKTRFLNDDFSQQRYEWYRDGILNAFSVNILPDVGGASPPTKEEVRTRPELADCTMMYRSWDLAEYSGTTVPGNADALADRASKVLDLVERSMLWIPDEAKALYEEARSHKTDGENLLSGELLRGGGVKKEGDKWVAYSESGNKLGEHDNEKDAKDQLAAYYVHKDKDKDRAGGLNLLARYIRHEGDKWIVYSESGKKLGEHDSEGDAKKQLAAIEANKGRSWIEESGSMFIVRGANGEAITATRDKALAVDVLEVMTASARQTFETELVQLQNQMRMYQKEMDANREEFKQYMADMLELMIHGRV